MENPQQPKRSDAYPPQGAKVVEGAKGVGAATATAAKSAGTVTATSPAATPQRQNASELLNEILAGQYRVEGMTAQGFRALHERLEAMEQALNAVMSNAVDTKLTRDDPDSKSPEQESPTASDDAAANSGSAPAADSPNGATSEPQTFPELPPAVAEPSPQAVPLAQPIASHPAAAPLAHPHVVHPVQQPIPQPVQPVRDVRPVGQPAGGELEFLVFGHDFPQHPALVAERQSLSAAVRQGNEDAITLVGQMLIFRAATMDRMAQQLKDVGEAWYRWRPDQPGAAQPMRDAVIAWLHHRLERAGLANRIELVRAGDRYDSKRHNAKDRGVEVTAVYGWVVLRDNGSVYTKANVAVA